MIHPDLTQSLAVSLCLANAVCIASYYGRLGAIEHLYVSDMIFSLIPYRVLTSTLTATQIILCTITMLHTEPGACFAFEITALVLTALGWITLNSRYQNTDTTICLTHLVGTGIFVAGNIMTFLFMIRTTANTKHKCMLAVLVFTMHASVGTGIGFIVGFFTHKTFGWMCEHLSFMLLALVHAEFFSLRSPIAPPDPVVCTIPACVLVPIFNPAGRKTPQASTWTETPP
jgi:hypothetical protein